MFTYSFSLILRTHTNSLTSTSHSLPPSFSLAQVLSLLDNPVVLRPHYRLFAIHRLPALSMLDFVKVTKTEREAAAQLFASAVGQQVRRICRLSATLRNPWVILKPCAFYRTTL